MELINKLRIWLAYYIMPRDTREHFIKALSYVMKELEMEVAELIDEMNTGFYTHDDTTEGILNEEK